MGAVVHSRDTMTIDDFGSEVERMDDDEIRGFLSSQSVGVLGLDADGPPSMRPMSFWFDGDATLYFLYILGDSSRKEELSARTDAARFLVYRAETAFNWRSVLVTGRIEAVSDEERDAVRETMDLARRPEVFERAEAFERTAVYRLTADDWTGIKHLGLPPEFEAGDGG
jgi:nitroimidazol reductase NimA-like FMN-containing flavoprotein (pyridoxamine 5'-phosphate oxidase superfamily)